MKVVRTARAPIAAACQYWCAAAISSPESGPSDAKVDRYQVQIQVEQGSPLAAFERVRSRLFTYDIFPPRFLQACICPTGPITEGATIVQRVVLGPLALEMAVRVLAKWDRQDGARREAGFCYATLAGHAECGVETFRVHLTPDQRVIVQIEARSLPGTRLTRLGRPVARMVQLGLTRAALRRLETAGCK